MQYFHVFNRRYMNDNSDLSPKWSQMYAESMIGGQKVHGIVLSSTVAVYNDSVSANSTTPPLLGVVGTDLPLDSLNQENCQLSKISHLLLTRLFVLKRLLTTK